MRTWILASILALVTLYYVAMPEPEETAIVHEYKDRAVMNEICELMKYNCSQVEAPTVVITHLVPQGYYGLYFPGEKYIFINYDAMAAGMPYRTIEIHETVHYIQHELGLNVTRCDGERYARSITAILTDTEVSPDWEERYGCKKPGE